MNTGVYMIKHRVSGKKYIGSTARSFSDRWCHHRKHLRAGTHYNKHLQAAWNKYGEKEFLFHIIKTCLPDEVFSYEQAFIDLHQACDPKRGYNNAPIAGSPLGIKRTDEVKANMSAAKRGRKASAEHRAKISAGIIEWHTRYKASVETRAKISAAQIGRKRNPPSAETRKKLSEAMKLRPPISAETRKKLSQASKLRPPISAETRKKLSEASTGRKHTAEARAKMSASRRLCPNFLGRKHTAETLAKMSAAQMGHKTSVETRAKLSAARKLQQSHTAETRAKMSAALKGRQSPFLGRKHTAEARAKMSASLKALYVLNNQAKV